MRFQNEALKLEIWSVIEEMEMFGHRFTKNNLHFSVFSRNHTSNPMNQNKKSHIENSQQKSNCGLEIFVRGIEPSVSEKTLNLSTSKLMPFSPLWSTTISLQGAAEKV